MSSSKDSSTEKNLLPPSLLIFLLYFCLLIHLLQWHQASTNISKDALCNNHFLAILCVFGGIGLINSLLMNSAANAFYNTGLVLQTLQDAFSLMEQVFKSSVAPFAFLLILFVLNQLTAIAWSLGGQVVLHRFLKLHIPGWLHYATIRVIASVPAFFCVFSAGAEGMYQLLIFTQVIVALLLPSSLIPLFRVAASRSIMGVHKTSPVMEFLLLIMFIGILGLNSIFVFEMIFGISDWVGNLRWTVGNDLSVCYVLLLVAACASFGSMLWLAATPLKSASIQLDAQTWMSELPKEVLERDEPYFSGTGYCEDRAVLKEEPLPTLPKGVDYFQDVSIPNFRRNLPDIVMEPKKEETAMEPKQEDNSTDVNKTDSHAAFPPSSIMTQCSQTTSEPEPVPLRKVLSGSSDVKFLDTQKVTTETSVPVEKTVDLEGDTVTDKDDDMDMWETDDLPRAISSGAPDVTSDGPPSFRSFSGRSEEGGSNNGGSLSKLAGLGRAARRQLTGILDEFWGQLYDFHGQSTDDSKSKKWEMLLAMETKPARSLLIIDASEKEPEYLRGKGSDGMINAGSYESPKHQNVQNITESYGVQMGSSILWKNAQNSSRNNVLDSGERRYSSVRSLPTSEVWNHQPVTVHGYQMASYLNRADKDGSADGLTSQLKGSGHLMGFMEMTTPKSSSVGTTKYRDFAFALGRPAPGFENVALSRNRRPYYNFPGSGLIENSVGNSAGSVNNKKYYSLPDISGYSIHRGDISTDEKNGRGENRVGYGSSTDRSHCVPTYSNTGSRMASPLAFDELSPSKVYSDALSSQLSSGLETVSLWSRQPYEQFGVSDKIQEPEARGVLNVQSATTQETTIVHSEAKLLQIFRHCIVKLLRLEGSDWLFGHHDGADEDLIDCVAAREKFLYEAEAQSSSSDRKSGSDVKINETSVASILASPVPHCGEGCVWRSGLIVSFGVWCIHRILDLSIMESRPELWGKYTYVLNRLQGIIDPAFSKPRNLIPPCFCLQVPAAQQQKSSPSASNGMLPPTAKQSRGKFTSAAMILDLAKDVEISISCRKGRSGTAAGDVAFPKGKENLASVLKRYKRRLSNKAGGTQDGTGSQKTHTPAS